MIHVPSPSVQSSSALLRWMAGDLYFTVISNNCWGSYIYQALDIPSRTPFVGMFIPPKSYLHLLKRFDACIRAELEFAGERASSRINLWRKQEGLSYPIGLLEGNVELHFLHLADENKARQLGSKAVSGLSLIPRDGSSNVMIVRVQQRKRLRSSLHCPLETRCASRRQFTAHRRLSFPVLLRTVVGRWPMVLCSRMFPGTTLMHCVGSAPGPARSHYRRLSDARSHCGLS